MRSYLQTCGSILQAVPPPAMSRRHVGPWRLVELPSVAVIEMRLNKPERRPTINRLLMHTEAVCHFLLVQHPALAKTIIA